LAKGTYHRVRDGQDITFLAEWYYGDPTAARHIYYANLDVYGDDFELIPAGAKVFIPDLEVSDTVESYTGPTVPKKIATQHPIRSGPVKGGWRIEREPGGDKAFFLTFTGEGQNPE
jgi:hypothetical protein